MQYMLSKKSNQGIRELMDLLKLEGYQVYEGLDTLKDDDHIIGICVDLDDRIVFPVNASIMAAWSGGKRRPLYVEEVISNFDRLIKQQDISYYEHLSLLASNDHKRPFGMLIALELNKN